MLLDVDLDLYIDWSDVNQPGKHLAKRLKRLSKKVQEPCYGDMKCIDEHVFCKNLFVTSCGTAVFSSDFFAFIRK